MRPARPIGSDAEAKKQLATLLERTDPVLGEEWLALCWQLHVLDKPKGRQPPTATFTLGPLKAEMMARLRSRHPCWMDIANQLLWPSDVATHWDPDRTRSLYAIVDQLPGYLRNAHGVAPGNTGDGWEKPVLLTRAPKGLFAPVAVMPGKGGIVIRSLVTPVAPAKMRRLEKQGEG